MVAFKIARFAIEKSSLGYAYRIIIKAFWSPKQTLRHVQRLNDKWNRNKRVELVECQMNSAIVRLHWNKEMDVSKDLCLYNQRGLYVSVDRLGRRASLPEGKMLLFSKVHLTVNTT